MDTLASLIDQLSDPACYPGEASDVQIYQTHISVVCVVGQDVYKLKKPVKLPFLDFSTVALRKHFCEEEVRLNRRLCPEIYRGVVPMYKTERGVTFKHSASAKIVDHAVLMARLPQDRMLDELLAKGSVSAAEIRGLAKHMVKFHEHAERSPEITQAGEPSGVRRHALENFEETVCFKGSLFHPKLHDRLRSRTEHDFDRWLPVLEERARHGFVVDGHGDLHARNICLTNPPAVYDCIEFNDSYRCGDTATEHAFLVMDLRYRKQALLADTYLKQVMASGGDDQLQSIVPMFVRYRAMVRAKVSAFASGEIECGIQARRTAASSARRHLNLAGISAVEEDGPQLILTCGLPGTGKTFVSQALALQSGWTYLASDRVRKELVGVSPGESAPASAYTEAFSEKTYRALLDRACAELHSQPVIIDANFRSRQCRAKAVQLAHQLGVRVCLLWFQASDGVVRERLAGREKQRSSASDATLAVYHRLKAAFQAPSEDEGTKLIAVDGHSSRDEVMANILADIIEVN